MKKGIRILLGIIFFLAFVSPVSAQSILKDGKIPEDLVITISLSSTIQFAHRYNYRISSDGKVFFEDFSTLPPARTNNAALLLNSDKNKLEPKQLKAKLSRKQIREIIREFEKSGFFEMDEHYRGDPALMIITCINHADTKEISITANGQTKRVAFFLGCSYGDNSPLQNFLVFFDRISQELKTVKKRNLKNQ